MEVTRRFSLAKRKCGMGRVTAKLRETAAHVIDMSVLALNLRKIQCALLRMLIYLLEILAQKKNWDTCSVDIKGNTAQCYKRKKRRATNP